MLHARIRTWCLRPQSAFPSLPSSPHHFLLHLLLSFLPPKNKQLVGQLYDNYFNEMNSDPKQARYFEAHLILALLGLALLLGHLDARARDVQRPDGVRLDQDDVDEGGALGLQVVGHAVVRLHG